MARKKDFLGSFLDGVFNTGAKVVREYKRQSKASKKAALREQRKIKEPIVPIMEFKRVREFIPKNMTVVAQSEVPAWCNIGELVFEKRYDEAIQLGKKLLAQNPYSAGTHINLMDAYFKSRNENNDHFDMSTYHAKQAMICGHNTGYAQKRLVINLEKSGRIHQAIQLCDIILDDKFFFSAHGCGSKEDFLKRKESLLKKVSKAIDSSDELLFTNKAIKEMLNVISE